MYAAGSRSADFRGANLQNTDFSDAILIGTNFESADLRKANLRGVRFIDADINTTNNINLTGTNLSDAILLHAVYKDTQLENAILCNTILRDGLISNRDCRGTSNLNENESIGEILCGGYTQDPNPEFGDYINRRLMLSATIEPDNGEFNLWIRETDGRFLLKLSQNLVVQEAYSVEGVEYFPWNLVAYDGSPMQINQDGSFCRCFS
jgi:uncharacterized protein YjbI with pentapeptide repeats